ncbi:uncharacterized protein LOC134532655 isoform X2 [Bacillus rossius redtenbacheri]|uniref:uncharacterized protein LOC134532655 isoform X2 n=1 Tax=Bacillus rossius redtenbacheri TaxID=93214 RepID=UPI002FDDA4F0
MLGVLKRRWKPKRAAAAAARRQGAGKQEAAPQGEAADRPRPASSTRQIHPLCDDKAQVLAYEATAEAPPPPAEPAPAPPPYLLAPNICVEGGRIEFVKAPPGGSTVTLGPAVEKGDAAKERLEERVLELERALEAEQKSGQRERLAVARLQRQLARREVLQRDVDRERRLRLDTEVRLRDSAAEAERCRARLAALQREFSRMDETVRSMLQYKTRAELLKQEKTSLTVAYETRIHQFQNTITKLNKENEALKNQIRALEAAGAGEVQSSLVERLRLLEAENSSLTRDAEQQRTQYERCLDDVANQVVKALLSQKQLNPSGEMSKSPLSKLPSPHTQPSSSEEHCSSETVSALLASLGSFNPSAVASDLYSPASGVPLTPMTSEASISTPSTGDLATPDEDRQGATRRRLWGDQRRARGGGSLAEHPPFRPPALVALAAGDPVLWLPVQRPRSLDLRAGGPAAALALAKCCQHRAKPLVLHVNKKQSAVEEEGSESPESGNRDEGYSTMSSDVQGDAVRTAEPGGVAVLPVAHRDPRRGLEDLKEETDAVGSAVPALADGSQATGRLLVVEDVSDPDVFYVPIGLTLGLSAGNPRHSFPPARDLLPYQHIMRSFSDSHLCLRFTTASSPACEGVRSTCSLSSTASSSPSVAALHDQLQARPLRRARAAPSLLEDEAGPEEEDAEGGWWDADYVQHWLRLDDTQSTLQQQHRGLLELEYDRAEMEDWSMSLSSEDVSCPRAGGQGEDASGRSAQHLPSIRENNALELEEDSSECLWNSASYLADKPDGELVSLLLDGMMCHNSPKNGWPYGGNFSMASPGGSWSSTGTNSEDCCHSYDCSYVGCSGAGCENDSKRSSAAMSGCSDDATSMESPAIGTDFTRDFYRLVKYESTKSLASTSSRSLPGNGNFSENGGSLARKQGLEIQHLVLGTMPLSQDREQALQSVLNFIAEQQQYCASREQQDSAKENTLPGHMSSVMQIDKEVKRVGKIEISDMKVFLQNCSDSFTENVSTFETTKSDADRPSETSVNCLEKELSKETELLTETSQVVDEELWNKNSRIIDENEFHETNISNTCRTVKDVDTSNKLPDVIQFKIKEESKDQRHAVIELETIQQLYPEVQENEIQKVSNKKSRRTEVLNEQNSSCRNVQVNNKTSNRKSDRFNDGSVEGGKTVYQHQLIDVDGGLGHIRNVSVENAANLKCVQESVALCSADSVRDPGSEEKCDVVDGVTSAGMEQAGPCEGGKPTAPDGRYASVARRASDVLVTVMEEDDEHASLEGNASREMSESLTSTVSTPDTVVSPGVRRRQQPPEEHGLIVMDARAPSFHERATSKDVIEELNRMIRKGEEGAPAVPVSTPGACEGDSAAPGASRLDVACCCPTGWVHVERDIDFTDPKARANLLDVMLASSGSSSSSSSSSDSGDEPADYQHLHRLHRFRRQKKASASREQMGVLRYPASSPRPSIIGREGFYVRYGEKEREAVASFDFLEELSTTSASGTSSGETASRRRGSSEPDATTPGSEEGDGRTEGQVSLGGSCGASLSGSSGSLETRM